MAIVVLAGICTLLLRPAPLLGHDWLVGLYPGEAWYWYFPWIAALLEPLRLLTPRWSVAVLQGVTISVLSVVTFRYAWQASGRRRGSSLAAVLLVLLSPLPWAMLWLGQIDVLVLLGLYLMPYGALLLTAKPNVGVWVALSGRKHLLWFMVLVGIAVGVATLLGYPVLTGSISQRIGGEHPSIMGWQKLGWHVLLVGIGLLLLTDRNPWRLLAAGSLISPFTLPYHYFSLLPALGTLRGPQRLVLWLASFLVLLPLGVQSVWSKYVGLIFPVLVWVMLGPTLTITAYRDDPDLLANRILSAGRQLLQRLGVNAR